MLDRNHFSRKLEDIVEMFTTKPLNPTAYEYFYQVAKDHPQKRVFAALDSMATTCKHTPKPADLREHIQIVSEGTGWSEEDEFSQKLEGWRRDNAIHPDEYPTEEWVAEWKRHTERTLGFKLDLSEPVKRTRGDEV